MVLTLQACPTDRISTGCGFCATIANPMTTQCAAHANVSTLILSKHKLLRPVDVDDYNADSSATMDTRSSSADVAYRREMTALRKVGQHLHLCGLMGTFETASAFYVVLELVEGPPLFDW